MHGARAGYSWQLLGVRMSSQQVGMEGRHVLGVARCQPVLGGAASCMSALQDQHLMTYNRWIWQTGVSA